MSNWCMGCGKDIPNGDYCSLCKCLGADKPIPDPPVDNTVYLDDDGNPFPF